MSEESIEETLEKNRKALEEMRETMKNDPAFEDMRSYENFQDLIENGAVGHGIHIYINRALTREQKTTFFAPEVVNFFCASEKCGRMSEFFLLSELENGQVQALKANLAVTLNYRCRFCDDIHSVTVRMGPDDYTNGKRWTVKVGEWPRPGEPLSKALLKLAGTSGSMLKRGYQCEMDGLGVAAYAYYRRVLHDQTTNLLQEIRKVAIQAKSSEVVIENLNKAIATRSYENSLNRAKGFLPRELYEDDKNPLDILHNMVSAGLHGFSDKDCLDRAELLREVLEYIVQRINTLLQEPQRLRVALGKVEKATMKTSDSGSSDDGNAPAVTKD